MTIGNQLRQRREEQAISLDQAAQATHIRLRYLEALEADQFDLLPSAAHVRGFLRAYGDYLKLNTPDLIRSLDADKQATPVIQPSQPVSEVLPPASKDSDAIFKEIGQKLRTQRELMGVSLGDVERHTHLRVHYVRALEEGDIAHLPSPVQGRGMLSNYASFLGLNTESVLLRFADGLQASLADRQAARNTGKSKSPQAGASSMQSRPSQLRRLFSMDLFASGFLIIFLLGFAIWGALRISALRSSQEPSPTAPPVSEILLSSQGDVISATITTLPTNMASMTSTTEVNASLVGDIAQATQTELPVVIEPTPGLENAPVQVYIVARQRAWMRLTVDGEVVFEGRVVPGSAYSFAANERIVLLTGDGAGLQVLFNQQDLGVLGAFGEVVERIFSIEGMQTPTPAVPPTRTPAPTGTVTSTPTSTRPGPTSTPSPTLKP